LFKKAVDTKSKINTFTIFWQRKQPSKNLGVAEKLFDGNVFSKKQDVQLAYEKVISSYSLLVFFF
jgi:hypothetical protein